MFISREIRRFVGVLTAGRFLTGAFGAGLGGAVDGTAAVVAAATSETHAMSRFTQVSSYVVLIWGCCEWR